MENPTRVIDIPITVSTRLRLNRFGMPGDHVDTAINNLVDVVEKMEAVFKECGFRVK